MERELEAARPEPVDTRRVTARPARWGEAAVFRGCLFGTVIGVAGYCVIMFVIFAARYLLDL